MLIFNLTIGKILYMPEKRFYDYKGIDMLFAPIANKLTPIFLYLKISANKITILSAIIGISGAILLSSNNNSYVLIGSFGYFLYYLFDYIDGNVARYNSKSSISGMFLDIFMSPIVAIATSTSLYIGGRESALNNGLNIFLANVIGIIFLLSILISYARFPIAWLTIGSKLVQDRFENKNITKTEYINHHKKRPSKILVKIIIALFHENFMIFSLPLIGIIYYIFKIDIRFLYPLLGSLILFPACIYELYSFVKYDKLTEIYYDIINETEIVNPIKTIYLK